MSEKYDHNVTKNYTITEIPIRDPEWRCYLFGSSDTYYVPLKGAVPNWFVRWMMKICFRCRWVKVSKH